MKIIANLVKAVARPRLAMPAIGLALTLLLGVPGLAKEQAQLQFDYTPIDVPNSTSTDANGNSTHEIVGDFTDADNKTHGFVLNKGVYTTIDVPAALITSVNGINANGELSGTYFDTKFHSFILSKGVFTTLDPPGSARTQGGFLNAQGQVVGTYRDSSQVRYGFVWSKGVFTTLDVPGANKDPQLCLDKNKTCGTVAFGINDPEQVVGTYTDMTRTRHGFLLSKGVYTSFDPPGSTLTVAEGINNAGQIVGGYIDANGHQHGFVLSKGIYTTIDVKTIDPTSTATSIFSINAQGEIVGIYIDANGNPHGFLGTPAH